MARIRTFVLGRTLIHFFRHNGYGLFKVALQYLFNMLITLLLLCVLSAAQGTSRY